MTWLHRVRRWAGFLLWRVLTPWLGLVMLLVAAAVIRAVYFQHPLPEPLLEALEVPAEQARVRDFDHGSGFFVSEDGLIFTARPVVEGCATLAASDDAGHVYPVSRVAARPGAPVALVQAFGAQHHPYLALFWGRMKITGEDRLVATGAMSDLDNPAGREPIRSIVISNLVRSGDRRFAAPLDWNRQGPMFGSSGGPLTLNDDRVLGLIIGGHVGGLHDKASAGWQTRATAIDFATIQGLDDALSPALWARITTSSPALRGVPIQAVVRLWCHRLQQPSH